MKMLTKFKLEELKKYANFPGVSLMFMPSIDADINKSFAQNTPSGKIELTINNPNLVNTFEVGQEYIVEFSLVESSDQPTPF
jgi:hypothetical protein